MLFLLPASLVLCGCADQKNTDSELIQNQIGRWSIVPAQEGYPALLLDSVTGCVMTALKSEKGEIVLGEAKYPNGDMNCGEVLETPTVRAKG